MSKNNDQMAKDKILSIRSQTERKGGGNANSPQNPNKHSSDFRTGKKAMAKGEFLEIEVEDLEPFRLKEGEDFSEWDEDDFEELKLSIEQYGVLHPLIVRPLNDVNTKFEILAGEHRWKASKALFKRRVPCRIFRCDDDTAKSVFALTNLCSRELTVSDKITWYSKYYLATRWKRQDAITKLKEEGILVLPDSTDLSRKQLARYHEINSMPEALSYLAKNEIITISSGAIIAKFSPDELSLLINYVDRITSEQVIKKIINLHKGKYEGQIFDEDGLEFVTSKQPSVVKETSFSFVVNHAKSILKNRLKKEDYENAPQILNDALDMYSEFGADKAIIAEALKKFKESE